MSKNVPRLRFKIKHEDYPNWDKVEINKVTSYVDYRGKTPPKVDAGVFLVTAKNIKDGFIDYECSKEYVRKEDYEKIMSRGVPLIGDVLITTEAPLGNVAQIDNSNVALAQRVIKYRGNKGILDNTFLKYEFLSDSFQKKILNKATGGTVKGIKGSTLHKVKINLPSLEEQVQIGSFLSTIDSRITNQSSKLDSLQELKKGVMQKIFSQEIRFKREDGGEYPEWEEKRLDNIAEIRTGYTPPRKDTSNFGEDVIWFSVADMKSKYLYDSKEKLAKKSIRESKFVEPNSLLMSFKLSVGVLGITKVRCMTNEAIANFTWLNEDTSNEYMFYYLGSHDIVQYGNNATQGVSLNSNGLARINVMLPVKEEQQKIADFLSTLDSKISLESQILETLQTLKKGLLQQMFV